MKNQAARQYANNMANFLRLRKSATDQDMPFDEPRPRLPKILYGVTSHTHEAPLRTRIKIGSVIRLIPINHSNVLTQNLNCRILFHGASGHTCFPRDWPCLVCRAQAKARYLHQHPSQGAGLLHERYTWEQDDLYDRPLNFELAMLAGEKHFFHPWTIEAYDHYIDQHVPSYVTHRNGCSAECGVDLGRCVVCAERMMLSHIVGHDEFDKWIEETCDELGMCPGCGGTHDPDE